MKKIAINAGHYPGLDSGAVGATGLQEAHVAQDIMQLVMYYLQQVGYETIQIQENELQDICDQSNRFGADLFVSIHCNAAGNTDARGTETWYFGDSENGHKLAQYIDDQIVNTLSEIDRGARAAIPHKNGLYVLSNTDALAVLVETAFISNPEDEALLASEKGKDDFARAIAVGITNYVASL